MAPQIEWVVFDISCQCELYRSEHKDEAYNFLVEGIDHSSDYFVYPCIRGFAIENVIGRKKEGDKLRITLVEH